MKQERKIKFAGIWQLLEVSGLAAFQITYFAVMARILSKDDYGVMAVASAVIGVGTIFINGGMGTALIQRKVITRNHVNSALQISFVMGVAVFSSIYVSSPWIARFYNIDNLESIVRAVSVSIL